MKKNRIILQAGVQALLIGLAGGAHAEALKINPYPVAAQTPPGATPMVPPVAAPVPVVAAPAGQPLAPVMAVPAQQVGAQPVMPAQSITYSSPDDILAHATNLQGKDLYEEISRQTGKAATPSAQAAVQIAPVASAMSAPAAIPVALAPVTSPVPHPVAIAMPGPAPLAPPAKEPSVPAPGYSGRMSEAMAGPGGVVPVIRDEDLSDEAPAPEAMMSSHNPVPRAADFENDQPSYHPPSQAVTEESLVPPVASTLKMPPASAVPVGPNTKAPPPPTYPDETALAPVPKQAPLQAPAQQAPVQQQAPVMQAAPQSQQAATAPPSPLWAPPIRSAAVAPAQSAATPAPQPVAMRAPAYAPAPSAPQPVPMAVSPQLPYSAPALAPAYQPAPVPAPSMQATSIPQKPAPMSGNWQTARGADMKDTLQRWSAQANVKVVWDTHVTFPVLGSIALNGSSYENAVSALLEQYDHESQRPVGTLYVDPKAGQRVLVIQAM